MLPQVNARSPRAEWRLGREADHCSKHDVLHRHSEHVYFVKLYYHIYRPSSIRLHWYRQLQLRRLLL